MDNNYCPSFTLYMLYMQDKCVIILHNKYVNGSIYYIILYFINCENYNKMCGWLVPITYIIHFFLFYYIAQSTSRKKPSIISVETIQINKKRQQLLESSLSFAENPTKKRSLFSALESTGSSADEPDALNGKTIIFLCYIFIFFLYLFSMSYYAS